MKQSIRDDKNDETVEFHQDTWNRYHMLEIVLSHDPVKPIFHLELRLSYDASNSDAVQPSCSTLRNVSPRQYSLAVNAIKKKLPSRNRVSIALDRGTWTNTLTRKSVITSYGDQNWSLGEVQLAFNDVDYHFFSYYPS